VLGLRDHERRPNPDDARRLAQDHFDPARVLVARDLACLLGRLDVREPDDAALSFRDDFLRQHDDVAVLELDRVGDELGEVVADANLGQAGDRDDANVVQEMPVSRIPACVL
jgi:hypothetical protein